MTNRWPQSLPGGKVVVFTASSSPNIQAGARIEALSLKTGEHKNLVRGGYYGRYLPSGHLLFVRDGVLVGVPFDPDRLEVRGATTPLLDDVAANPSTGGGEFDFSSNGTFVYAAGKSVDKAWQMMWLDSTGRMQPLLKAPRSYALPRISPDGCKVAFADGPDIYIHDLNRDTTTRLTNSSQANSPVWAPDNKHVVFQSVADEFSLYWIRSDGAGDPELLLKSSSNLLVPWSFSPDGRWLA
jgi:serine/threonine-protein kinase